VKQNHSKRARVRKITDRGGKRGVSFNNRGGRAKGFFGKTQKCDWGGGLRLGRPGKTLITGLERIQNLVGGAGRVWVTVRKTQHKGSSRNFSPEGERTAKKVKCRFTDQKKKEYRIWGVRA